MEQDEPLYRFGVALAISLSLAYLSLPLGALSTTPVAWAIVL
jgi:hypothetical protein